MLDRDRTLRWQSTTGGLTLWLCLLGSCFQAFTMAAEPEAKQNPKSETPAAVSPSDETKVSEASVAETPISGAPESSTSSTGKEAPGQTYLAERAELEQFFQELVKIRQTRDGLAYGRLFDVQRMMRELGNQGVLRGAGFTRVLTLWTSLQVGLRVGAEWLLARDGLTVESFRLGNVTFNAERDEAEAYVLFQNAETNSWWTRVWFVRRDGAWRIFDHQQLDSGIRFTTNMAELGSSDLPEKQQWRRAKQLVDEAWRIHYNSYGDENAMQTNLQTARSLAKHPATEIRRRLYELYAASVYGATPESRKLLDALLKLPNIEQQQPIIFALQAQIADDEGEHKTALDAANKFIEQVGPDEEICRVMGDALLALERQAEAVAAFRLGLAVEPGSIDCLAGLGVALDDASVAEVGDYFAKFPDPRASFESVAMEFHERERAEPLLALVVAFRKIAPDDPNSDYYEAMAWLLKKEPGRAAQLLKAAIPRVDDEDERGYYVSAYYQAMIDDGRAVEAYREAENPAATFIELSDLLEADETPDQQRKLIEAHRENHPRDPQLFYYLGGVEQREKRFDEAEAALATGMRFALDAETLEALRVRRVEVAVAAKRALEAYRNIPPRRKTFVEIARQLRDAEQGDVLEQLVTLHRQEDRRDPAIPMWDAEVAWLKKDYAAAAKALIAGRAGLAETDIPLWTYEDRLIRSLIRADRFEEAENIATGIEMRDEDNWYLLIVYAAWKEEEEAIRHAEKWLDDDDYSRVELIREMYKDEDLGPAIRSKGFAKFRAKFPEPKQ